MGNTLILLSETYPYGEGEQFIENELWTVHEDWDRILVFPLRGRKNDRPRELPSNVEVHPNVTELARGGPYLMKAPFRVLRSLFHEISKSGKAWHYLKRSLYYVKALAYSLALGDELIKELRRRAGRDEAIVFYSYWLYSWCSALALLQKRGVIEGFVSRAHLGDLYDGTLPGRLVPFKALKLEQAFKVFPVSQHGASYLKKAFPSFSDKVEHRYLGVEGPEEAPFDPEARITLLSCSSITERKRPGRICELLRLLEGEIRWVHFGDGPLRKDLEAKVSELPSDKRVELKGHVSNEAIRSFLREETVHLFINMSRAEGIPVSMMEAASAGIPILAPSIYGIPELVGKEGGILFEPEADLKEIAQRVDAFLRDTVIQKQSRKAVRDRYEQYFRADRNYPAFSQELKEMARSHPFQRE